MKKGIVLLFISLPLFLIPCLYPQCPQEVKRKLFGASAEETRHIIESAKVAAFSSDTLLTKGLDQKSFVLWQGLLECAHDYVNEQVDAKKAPAIYKSYTKQLKDITNFMYATINYIVEHQGNINKDQLTTLSTNVGNELKNVQRIEVFSSRTIVNDSNLKVSDAWKKRVPADLDKIFPTYKTFFKAYDDAKKKTNGFAQNNSFINFLNANNFKTERDVTFLADKLEQFIHRIDLDIKNAPWYSITSEKKSYLAKAQDVIGYILNAYPLLITGSHFEKLTISQDKASLIIFLEAGALESALKSVLRGITKLQTSK